MKLVLAGAAGTLAATAAIVVALVAAVGWGNFAALRFFPLPAPSGPLPVGTRACAVAGGIPVQIWYPAATRSGARAPYEYGVAKPSLRARLIAGSVRTDAFLDAPIAGGKHALLLYVPSWGGLRTDNTAQAQNLASYGFIVVAMDDLYPEQPMDSQPR